MSLKWNDFVSSSMVLWFSSAHQTMEVIMSRIYRGMFPVPQAFHTKSLLINRKHAPCFSWPERFLITCCNYTENAFRDALQKLKNQS